MSQHSAATTGRSSVVLRPSASSGAGASGPGPLARLMLLRRRSAERVAVHRAHHPDSTARLGRGREARQGGASR